jgi:hypothetical protein
VKVYGVAVAMPPGVAGCRTRRPLPSVSVSVSVSAGTIGTPVPSFAIYSLSASGPPTARQPAVIYCAAALIRAAAAQAAIFRSPAT